MTSVGISNKTLRMKFGQKRVLTGNSNPQKIRSETIFLENKLNVFFEMPVHETIALAAVQVGPALSEYG